MEKDEFISITYQPYHPHELPQMQVGQLSGNLPDHLKDVCPLLSEIHLMPPVPGTKFIDDHSLPLITIRSKHFRGAH